MGHGRMDETHGTPPEDTAPDDTAPDDTAPDDTAPDDTAPDDIAFPVPNRFRRGAFYGMELIETGKEILDLACATAGVGGVDGLDILDFGSGYRMAQVLLQYDLPFRSYVGIDIDPTMIGWLREHNPDPRIAFELVPFRNDMYRPEGEPMTAHSALPVGDARFDMALMLSVVTHLAPPDTEALFSILRRYVRPDGFLYFSAFVNPLLDADFQDGVPDKPLWMAIYQEDFLFGLLERAGWATEFYGEPRGQLIQHQFLCRPTDDPHPPRPPRRPYLP